jgi:hypothetical protein
VGITVNYFPSKFLGMQEACPKPAVPELEDIFHERCSKALASFWIQLLDIMSASHGYLSYPLLPAGKDLG